MRLDSYSSYRNVTKIETVAEEHKCSGCCGEQQRGTCFRPLGVQTNDLGPMLKQPRSGMQMQSSFVFACVFFFQTSF